jgi:hypothetical protein
VVPSIPTQSAPINLADPAFEPTDAQLQELSARAFADVRAARERSLEQLRTEIAREREKVLLALEADTPGRDGP